jgi:soluble lytic murein transglycosylase
MLTVCALVTLASLGSITLAGATGDAKTKAAAPATPAKVAANAKTDAKTTAKSSDRPSAKTTTNKAPTNKTSANKTSAKSDAKTKADSKPSAKSTKSTNDHKTSTAKSPAKTVTPSKASAKSAAAKPTPAKPAAAKAATPSPRPRPTAEVPLLREPAVARTAAAVPMALPLHTAAPAVAVSGADLDALKQVIAFARKGRSGDASNAQASIRDPLARKLAEWIILRSDDNNADFARYNAFIAANPDWPSIVTLRKRAESMMWFERLPAPAVRAFFADAEPLSTKGHFALARALLANGDRAGARAHVADAWRNDDFSADLESVALELFGDLITRADEKARMDRRLYNEDNATALRAAQRLGGYQPAVARACAAVYPKSGTAQSKKAQDLIDDLPAAAQNEPIVVFSRIQLLRRADRIAEAGALMLKAPRDAQELADRDEWWVERRLTARKLLDIGDARTAYRVVRDAATPDKENYRIDHEFTAGWIALRYLGDPATAAAHFARITRTATNPISLSRAGYWQGRAAEAANRRQEARAFYQAAARYSTAYYGQLARARLGLSEIALAHPASAHRAAPPTEVARAAELLYAAGERDLLVPFMADVPDKSDDVATLVQLAELANRHGDARSVLLVGKTALGRGMPFDHYAFPTVGLPRFKPIGADVEPAVVYAIARQESAFNPKVVSSANAMGLMQVTPAAGKYIAKKHGVAYDQKRLLNDTVYNVQFGAAELGDVLERHRGSYILAFAAYNAGAGRVREWIERYGDPRDPQIDAVDWVERIPFSETRNYVQRVMENLQVYRLRFGGGTKLLIEADLRRGTAAN